MTKHLRYIRYLVRHKWFVFQAGLRTKAPFWRLLIHDWTKFLPSEWFPYVQYFYGDNSDEGRDGQALYGLAEMAPYGFYAEDRFNIAWNYHQKRNRHHWQYWVITKDDGETFPLPIPMPVIREMVADWAGAGRAIKGKWDISKWYSKHRHEITLREEVRQEVESLITECFGPIPVIYLIEETVSG